MKINQILNNIYPLNEASMLKIKECIREIAYPKGHILLKAEKIETSIYYIKKGMVRAYSNRSGNETTFWFGKEGDAVISMKSYVENRKGYEDIELLENCEFYELKIKNLRRLFDEDINLANRRRRFAEQELVKTEERLISRQFRTAAERLQRASKGESRFNSTRTIRAFRFVSRHNSS